MSGSEKIAESNEGQDDRRRGQRGPKRRGQKKKPESRFTEKSLWKNQCKNGMMGKTSWSCRTWLKHREHGLKAQLRKNGMIC